MGDNHPANEKKHIELLGEGSSAPGPQPVSGRSPLGNSKFVLRFETPDGSMKEVTCSKKPLGLMYTKTTPLTVVNVAKNSHALDLGIKIDWKLRSVGDEDMEGKDSEYIFTSLFKNISALPTS